MTPNRLIRAHLALLALLPLAHRAHAQLLLRGGQRLDAPIVNISSAGVEVSGAQPTTLPWDRIARVEGDHAPHAEPFSSLADRAWRARSRLERADITLSEPLFDGLLLERLPGPTGAVVARGALRCRLDRGALASAVSPWIDTVALREHPTSLDPQSPLARVIDPTDSLCPSLPPIFLNDESALLLTEQPIDPRDDPQAAALASLYTAAARAARNDNRAALPPIDPTLLQSPPIALVHALVAAQIAPPSDRAAAQPQLRALIDANLGSFREAWARVALARSLAASTSDADRREAVVHYLHLPARFGSAQPYLTGVALAEASHLLSQLSDPDSARILRDELALTMPRHPALAWLTRAAPLSPAPEPAP
ncbi:MAG: hypothetical protein AB7G17_00285 [Phycisphaerales bacterium]